MKTTQYATEFVPLHKYGHVLTKPLLAHHEH